MRDEYQDISARVQDAVTLKYNNNFLDSSLVTSKYYIDILQSIWHFSKS